MRSTMKVASVAAVAALALAACSSGGTSAGEASPAASEAAASSAAPASQAPASEFTCDTITWWGTDQLGSPEKSEALYQPAIDAFTEKTGVNVDLEIVPWGDLYNKVIAGATSGQLPDVLNLGNTWAADFGNTGAFIEFTGDNAAAIGGLEKFAQPALGVNTNPASPTSVPIFTTGYGLYYNKKMFDELGLTPPTTWEELVEVGKSATDPAKDQWGFALSGKDWALMTHYAWILGSQEGAQFMDGTTSKITDDAVVRGFQRLIDLVQTDKIVNPKSAEFDDAKNLADFANGKLAMYWGPGRDAQIEAAGMAEGDYGMVPVPSPANGQPISTFIGGTNVSVWKDSACIPESLALVSVLTDIPFQEFGNGEISFIPPVAGAKVTFTQDQAKADAYADIIANRSNVFPISANTGVFQQELGNSAQALLQKAATGSVSEDDIRKELARADEVIKGSAQ